MEMSSGCGTKAVGGRLAAERPTICWCLCLVTNQKEPLTARCNHKAALINKRTLEMVGPHATDDARGFHLQKQSGFKCVKASWGDWARTESHERGRQSETESDIDQSGGEWDEAASSALAPTANQRDRVYIWPRNGPALEGASSYAQTVAGRVRQPPMFVSTSEAQVKVALMNTVANGVTLSPSWSEKVPFTRHQLSLVKFIIRGCRYPKAP